MMYRCPERSPQDSRDEFFLYSAQASFSWPRVDLARLLRRAYSRSVWIIFLSLSKSVGFVSLSGKASLVSISAAILFLRSWHVYFPLEFCRVSFIDLYLVFPRNFRMIFLPHTNTVILLERYCGTITEPGLPVLRLLYPPGEDTVSLLMYEFL